MSVANSCMMPAWCVTLIWYPRTLARGRRDGERRPPLRLQHWGATCAPQKAMSASPRKRLQMRHMGGHGLLFDHFGGAGIADEWWSTILQSLPSFTYVKL